MSDHTPNTVGVDISKAHLDAHALPSGRAERFANNAAGIRKLAASRSAARGVARSVDDWAIIGEPTAVRDRIAQYRRDLGITHLIVTRLRIGGVDATHLERSVETVASMFV